MPWFTLVCSHSMLAVRPPITGHRGSSASRARLAFQTDGCSRPGDRKSTLGCGVPLSRAGLNGSALKVMLLQLL